MFEKSFKVTEKGITGVMPSGVEKDFPNVEAYNNAYTDEENEIIDELARLYGENFIEYPEDYVA